MRDEHNNVERDNNYISDAPGDSDAVKVDNTQTTRSQKSITKTFIAGTLVLVTVVALVGVMCFIAINHKPAGGLGSYTKRSEVQSAPSSTPLTTPPGAGSPVLDTYVINVHVHRVIDGDTVDFAPVGESDKEKINKHLGKNVAEEGKSEPLRVRFVGVNTPEINYGKTNSDGSKKEPDCFAVEAKEFVMSELASTQKIQLVVDTTQSSKYGIATDTYGRSLAHVIYGDESKNLGVELLRGGYATRLSVNGKELYREQLDAAEQEAKLEQRGLWKECKTKLTV